MFEKWLELTRDQSSDSNMWSHGSFW